MPTAKRRIVVVDDSPTSLRFVVDTLKGAGFDVDTAKDGEEAIEKITNNPPDGVVLDILLPKKNGFQVCREIKTNPATKDVPIILLSSKRQETDRLWGQRQGADAYLTKPVQGAELSVIVQTVLSDKTNSPNQFACLPNVPTPVVSENS